MKLLIKHESKSYKFLTIKRTDDGSLIISLDRKTKASQERHVIKPGDGSFTRCPPVNAPRYLTYHTTGRVNYHGLVTTERNYFEPLTELTQLNFVLGISIPSATSLDIDDKTNNSNSDDARMIIDSAERFAVGFTVTPTSQTDIGVPAVKYAFDDLCLYIHPLQIDVEAPSPKHFLYLAPASLFPNQQLGKNEAELAYVQGIDKHQIVVRGPNGVGEYTMYFSTVMRRPPTAVLEFRDPDFRFDLRKNDLPHKLKFRIFGKRDLVREADLRPIIKSIVLDAELY